MKNISQSISRILTLLSFLLLYLGNFACAQTADFSFPLSSTTTENFTGDNETAVWMPLANKHFSLLLKEMMPCESEELQEEEEDENNHNHFDFIASGISETASAASLVFSAGSSNTHLPQRKRYLVFRCLRINC